MGEAGIGKPSHRVEHRLDVGPAGDGPGDVLAPYRRQRCGEPGGGGQFRIHLPSGREPPELLPGPSDGRLDVVVDTDRRLPVPGLP
jgi:hypothetical protein